MENYYQVTEQSPLYKEYMDYSENDKIIRQIAHEFLTNNKIDAKQYVATENTFYIIPDGNDLNNFGKILNKEIESGLRAFKAKSKIGKAWVEVLKENNVKPLHKPWLMSYFNVYGKTSSRLFAIENKVYCSFKSEYNFDNPEGFIELKASEFFRIIEEENELRRNLT